MEVECLTLRHRVILSLGLLIISRILSDLGSYKVRQQAVTHFKKGVAYLGSGISWWSIDTCHLKLVPEPLIHFTVMRCSLISANGGRIKAELVSYMCRLDM